MLRYSLYIFFIFGFTTVCSCQSSVIGKWRYLPPNANPDSVKLSRNVCGDLEVRSDFKFVVLGDSSKPSSNTPGWNVCSDFGGIWELIDGKDLLLKYDPQENKIFVRYKIISLSSKFMVLRSYLDLKSADHDTRYIRL